MRSFDFYVRKLCIQFSAVPSIVFPSNPCFFHFALTLFISLTGSFYGLDHQLTGTSLFTVYTRQDPFPRIVIGTVHLLLSCDVVLCWFVLCCVVLCCVLLLWCNVVLLLCLWSVVYVMLSQFCAFSCSFYFFRLNDLSWQMNSCYSVSSGQHTSPWGVDLQAAVLRLGRSRAWWAMCLCLCFRVSMCEWLMWHCVCIIYIHFEQFE